MSSFFGVGGNPFATQVGQRIEQATDGSLASENWSLNLEICDIINDTEDGPKDAIKAMRKRLQQNAGKNYTIVMYTLTVLETCVKNCNKRFHVLVCNKEFIQELVKLIEPPMPSWLYNTLWYPSQLQSLTGLEYHNCQPCHTTRWHVSEELHQSELFMHTEELEVHRTASTGSVTRLGMGGPKNDPPTAVQEKVLSLIQSWADAFRNQPDLSGVVHVYQDLKLKGIEFPMTDLDAMAPIHTPQRSIPDGEIPVGIPAIVAQQQGTIGRAVPSPPPAPRLTPEQMTKLHNDLDVVQANMAVLSEMLSDLTPGKEHPSDVQLLNELHATCKGMQQRLVELISKLANDDITAELLRVNDLLNNIFLRYSRFENNREAIAKGKASSGLGTESLIDLTDEASGPPPKINNQFAALSIGEAAVGGLPQKNDKDDSEFDMFAHSRNVTYESSKTGGSSYEANLKPDQLDGGLVEAVAQARTTSSVPQTAMHKESDFDEMAAWLGEEAVAPQESLTSSEFERFLAERAAAAEATPSPRHRRQNNDKEESSLYAL